ncbi:hypothetical protein DICSQDRAFT_172848 [Dichomitus squalens LYAD-421 SS1]|uniref:Uncharacterized protein n=1 Tax=Dichomitus squalens (strain LYAD-421) TaxID=732165 RepID=R7SR81_DICSQ|nr:uncharacterized protein DICSQDRAFT_172848 [Dichomitus squalens LYAD-421 SS1]EJF58659.1 hypothetical protein DICSQDRAFT_172848 [Dichomitus squalens LYAD-421 SS1]
MRKFKSKLSKRFKRFSRPCTDEARGASIDAKSAGLCTLYSGRTENDGIGRALRKLRGTTESVSPPLSRATGATAIEPATEAVQGAYELWKPVLDKVAVFASLIEAIGDLHPYAKIASKVLLSVVKPVIDQDKRDNAMADLLEAMSDLYDLVNKTGRFADLDQYRKKLLKDMSSKTEECAKFIRDEARFTNFCESVSRRTLAMTHTEHQQNVMVLNLNLGQDHGLRAKTTVLEPRPWS